MIHRINIAEYDFRRIVEGKKQYWHGLSDVVIEVGDIIEFNYQKGIPTQTYYFEVIVTDEEFLYTHNTYQIIHFRKPKWKGV